MSSSPSSSVSASSVTPRDLHASLLHYLSQLAAGGVSESRGVTDAEPLEVATQCIQEATGAEPSEHNKLVDAGLFEIFTRGVQAIRDIDSNPKFPEFLSLLRSKDFFSGCPEGSLDYAKRMQQARDKFQTSKFAQTSSAPASAADAIPAVEVSDSDKASAEAAKAAGNQLLGRGDHQGAVAKYTEAIKLNPRHAIYYANRAAAYVNLRQYDSAIADCRTSISLDPVYPKSHYRLGQCLASKGDYQACLPAFERALELSGQDESMASTIRDQIKNAKNKLNPLAAAASAHDSADPLSALGMGGAGAGLGGLDFGALLNNPMVQQMMNNPQMQEMMKGLDMGSLMKDMAGGAQNAQQVAEREDQGSKVDTNYKPPSDADLFDDEPSSTTSTASSSASTSNLSASSSASTAGLPPQLASFLNSPAGRSAASDPDLQPVLEDIKKGGMAAAMKHMGNPKVMQKVSQLMGPLMGGGRK